QQQLHCVVQPALGLGHLEHLRCLPGLEQRPQLVPADELVDVGHPKLPEARLLPWKPGFFSPPGKKPGFQSRNRVSGSHQYSSKWMFPLNLAAATSARNPRPSSTSITPIGCG